MELAQGIEQLRRELMNRGWSEQDLVDHIQKWAYDHGEGTLGITRSYVSEWLNGKRGVSVPYARRLQGVVGIPADHFADRRSTRPRPSSEELDISKLRSASLNDSRLLTSVAEVELDTEEIDSRVRTLAVKYLEAPPKPMLYDSLKLREVVLRRLRNRQYRPDERGDLYFAAGRLSGILAYAVLDLGAPDEALVHAQAAWACAERLADNELRAWVRGTESLITRFQGRYGLALQFVTDGEQYATRGTSLARILCGQAQSLANLGDSRGANHMLDLAEDARGKIIQPDRIGGLFEFSEAKQHYYAGSSLIWLDGGADAHRAVKESQIAIAMWEQESAETRSLDDEALAHIYLGTAQLQLDELDSALESIRPILELPPERRISWIKKRLNRFGVDLSSGRYKRSPLALEAREEIRAFST
jgi:transcriptional regulator with XRE-family HTH domain